MSPQLTSIMEKLVKKPLESNDIDTKASTEATIEPSATRLKCIPRQSSRKYSKFDATLTYQGISCFREFADSLPLETILNIHLTACVKVIQ